MWAVIIFAIWVIMSVAIGSATGPGIGYAVFFAPIAYFITYRLSDDKPLSWVISLGLIAAVLIANRINERTDKNEKKKSEELRQHIDEHNKSEAMMQEEIDKSASYISSMKDDEAIELYNDYQKYYLAGNMSEDIKNNFECKLIAKAKPVREAEKLRLAQEEARMAEEEARREALEREEYEKEQRRLEARYGAAKKHD